ncbi:MAG: dicarboxylate/amino acid:cation symporter [Xanthomonadales bacterium]|nr:dicarboxylate/amino acid:cation symporter [Xanthomonadales bacterium]
MSPSHALGGALTRRILIALAAGIVVGVIINLVGWEWGQTVLAQDVFDTFGRIFLLGLQMLIVPVVLVSLVCGVTSLANPAELGRMGGKAIALYLATTALAITIGLTLASFIEPGAGFTPSSEPFEPPPAQSIKEVILNMVPANPIKAMAEGKMLQLIVFAILLGLSITFAGESGKSIRKLFQDMNEVVMGLVTLVMWYAPIGVFALIAKICATLNWGDFKEMLAYFFTVAGALILHGTVTYMILLRTMAGLSPLIFLKKMRTAMTFAFSTSSSNATMPVTLRTVEKRLGVDNSVASFTVPLGATINMDGTAIMQGVATVFIANVYGVDLTLTQLMTVVLMAVLASVGTAGVPGVGIVMLATVLAQVGLPVEGIALILGVDRVLDMMRTVVNVTGDATVTSIVARSEGEFDMDVFNDPEAGFIEHIKPEPEAAQAG